MTDHKHRRDPLRNHGYSNMCSCGAFYDEGEWCDPCNRSDATCRTCPNCKEIDTYHGECRFHAPVIHEGPPWPGIDPQTDWCGEHPDRQPRIECAETTLVTNNSGGLSAADMYPIVDALEQMARCAARGAS